MKRADEEFCKDVFGKYLEGLEVNNIEWDEVPKSKEPPDYFLHIGEQQFAVEVTDLMESEDVGGRLHSSEGYNAALYRFSERLEQRAKHSGNLVGVHVLHLEPLANLKTREQEIQEGAFDYMRRTRGMKTGPRRILAQDAVNRIEIEKLGDHKDYLAAVISRGSGASEYEIKAAVRAMLQTALDKKRCKLGKIKLPKILLLLDRYHCAESSEWIKAARDTSLDAFCLVVRIWQDESVVVLYSDKKVWPV